jgi:FtsH-binding integral membrane protein
MVIVVFIVHMARSPARRYSNRIVVNQKMFNVIKNRVLPKNAFLGWLTLFVTSGTLLCCALPILLVSLGFGAVVASLNYNIPGLLFLAEHKYWTISLSGLLLLLLAWIIWRPNQVCPAEPELAAQCQKVKYVNQSIFWLSVGVWLIGVFFSVLLLPLRQMFTSQ